MPALAAVHFQQAVGVMSPCAGSDVGKGPMSHCPDQGGKACGLVACATVAIPIPDRTAEPERTVRMVAFARAPVVAMAGQALPPDPFPPRASALLWPPPA